MASILKNLLKQKEKVLDRIEKQIEGLVDRRPYTLDKTESKVVNGITLYQLVATENFEIPLVWHPKCSAIPIEKGERGGWVPSLDVLERSLGHAPWLDDRSYISHPGARLSGPLYLQNSQWEGSGAFIHESLDAWRVSDCRFTRHNHIHSKRSSAMEKLHDAGAEVANRSNCINYLDWGHTIPRAFSNSHFHNVDIEGLVRLKNVQLNDTVLRVQGETGIENSTLEHSQLTTAGYAPQSIKDVEWSKVTMEVSTEVHEPCVWEHLYWTNVQGAVPPTPTDPHYRPGVVNMSNCMMAKVNFGSNNPSGCNVMGSNERELVFPQGDHRGHWIPVVQPKSEFPRRDTHTPIHTSGMPCHFLVLYNTQNTPEQCYDTVTAKTFAAQDSAAYLQTLPPDSPSHKTLEWLQVQWMLDVQPKLGVLEYPQASIAPEAQQELERNSAEVFAPS